MTVVGNSDIQQALKAAAAEIKESVGKHGNVHPVVLQKLEAYIALLQQAGNQAEADKWNERASAIRKLLTQQGGAPAAAPAATPAAASAPASAPAPAAAPAPVAATPAPASKPPAPVPIPSPSDDGSFSLDGADDEEVSYEALEQAAATAKEAAASAPAAQSSGPSTDLAADEPVNLYNSQGEHVATCFLGYIYDPEGKNLGRYEADFECFVDRAGRYLGQVYDGNRLVREPTFRYANFNFGDRGNEGHRAGWGRTPDIERTTFPATLEDVNFTEEE
jgi:hypothetical protein